MDSIQFKVLQGKSQNIKTKVRNENDTSLGTFRITRDNMANLTYSTASPLERTRI